MKTYLRKKTLCTPAFTLIEMIIAITVFTIFIGFAISSYLMFHRADQEALEMRSLMMELEAAMNQISETVRANTIDYSYYDSESGGSLDILSGARGSFFTLQKSSNVINDSTLTLLSMDGETQYVYVWDKEDETLTLQLFDSEGNPLEATSEPQFLHNETTRISYANFRIFPDVNPYDAANASQNDVQYQPTVQIELTLTVSGRIREEVSLDAQTSVTSRFYQ